CFRKPEKLILISTIKSSGELPPHIRLLRYLPFHKILPMYLYNKSNVLAKIFNPVFGRMNNSEKQVFIAMVKDADPYFIKWAINQVVFWEGKLPEVPFLHIHG